MGRVKFRKLHRGCFSEKVSCGASALVSDRTIPSIPPDVYTRPPLFEAAAQNPVLPLAGLAAEARPCPCAAPVTNATRPASSELLITCSLISS
jgi:hypothetical protein